MATRTWFTVQNFQERTTIQNDEGFDLEFDTREEAETHFNELTKKQQKVHTVAEHQMNTPDAE